MTRATYNADNTITEQSQIPEPNKYLSYCGGILNEWYPKQIRNYDEHVAKLRTIPCSPECRGLWKEGQVLEEGKDYEVKWDYTKGTGKDEMAFPLPVKSEDDLWYKAIDLIMVAHDKGLSKEDAISVVKSQFIITKR